ncbi:MAG TPA: cadherin domain-containing protein, partial [Dongiaceae bacterium]
SASTPENVSTATAIYTTTATDPDAGTTLSYSITGTDAALFNINTSTGAVTFKSSRNFEAPTDNGANNVYDIVVHANDGSIDTTKAVAITVTNVNEAPVITSGASASTPENVSTATTVYSATATDPDAGTTLTYSITGTDAALFNINSSTGAVTFKSSPDFEAPADSGANNVYDIVVHANDGVNDTTKAVAISVTNANEAPVVDLNGAIAGSDASASYPHGVSQILIAPSATITDADSPNLASLIVKLTNPQDANAGNSAEALSLNATAATAATTAGLIVTYTSATGVLSITGSASAATYQTILEGVQYTDTKPGSHNTTSRIVTVVANDGSLDSVSHSVTISVAAPAGIAGSPINLALIAPTTTSGDPITVKVSGMPSGWTLNQGTNLGNGVWMVQTHDLTALEVTTASAYAGALVLNVEESWTNADGSTGSAIISDNVEAYAAGSPIFAWSGDDTLTGSAGKDSFVFADPIGVDTIHKFDASADQIDLIGFAGLSDFAALQGHIVNDANGNAVITLGDGETITLVGTDAAALTADNFAFDQEPVTHNAGLLTIGDGALLPLSGIVDNSGTIQLNAAGHETDLEIIQHGVTLQGGGAVVLSDDSHNTIYGSTSDTVLHNVDNTISGAGNIGAGQMTLVNDGTILADGSHALTIDTGSNHIANTGTLEATGAGGLVVESAIDNSGTIWANGGNVTAQGDVTGNGHAQISGSATLEFGGISEEDVLFDSTASGQLKLDHSDSYKGTVSGLDANDVLDFSDIGFAAGTTVNYVGNEAGTGGVLSVSDGVHNAMVAMEGQYAAAGFQGAQDAALGTAITYHPELATV